ncbi:MAG TPA: ABC transporter ATP-binding protein [Pyrinomonadaceae bacterium]|nr:ABC transporter ATP-binding protein [Pyrinomonadaceae bacterium]
MAKHKKKKFHLSHLLRPHRTFLVLGFIAVLGEAGADLLEPWPLKIVFDYVFGTKHMPSWMSGLIGSTFGATFGLNKVAILHFAVAAVIVIALVGALSAYAEKYLTTSVGQWVMHDLRRVLYHHIQRLSLAYHDQKPTGDLISTVTADIDAIQDFISQALLGIVVNVLTLAGMLVVMFYLNWRFTLIALSITPFLFAVVYTYTRRIKQASRALRKKEGEVVSVVAEVLSSIRVVKAFAREDYEEARLAQQSLENVEIALRARNLKAKLAPVVQVIVAVGTCLVLWYGVNLVMTNQMTSGSLLVFLLYLGKMYKPMRDLSKMTDTMSKAAVGYERIYEVIETEDEIRNLPGAKPAPNFKGEIEFDRVYFGYDKGYRTLTDVNLRVEPGQLAALVGPTGAGKTTIASLIGRFYDPQKGVVKIDGSDVRAYKLKSLRRQMSFVLQETLLFRAPVWQNIAYGKPEASRDEILRAAELANADEFIRNLPQQYDTMVGEKGVTLSGGQRQRIAIARAIIRNAPILILDEPTSGLDAASEELVFEALSRLMEGRTTIVIAHRLATVRRADVIFVIDHGTIVERGTHEKLLAERGLYSTLYDIQFQPQKAQETQRPSRIVRQELTVKPATSR